MMEPIKEVQFLGTNYKTIEDGNRKFRFTCDKCGRCCVNNKVMLNPYDLIRLSRNKKIPISELIVKYLTFHIGPDSNIPILMLKMTPRCVFNISGLCSVYDDRPLVCRSFPVGRVTAEDKDTKETKRLWVLNENCSSIPLRLQKVQTINEWVKSEEASEYYVVTDVWISFLADIAKNTKEETRKKEEWQINFFENIYLKYDALKEEEKMGLSDKEIMEKILDNAKKILIG